MREKKTRKKEVVI